MTAQGIADQVPPGASARALHALFAVSGALALAYEVLWMRRFSVLFGATGPSVAATVSAVFLGLALGSAVGGKLSARWTRPVRVFGLIEIGVGAGALAVGPLLDLHDPLHGALVRAGAGPALLVLAKLVAAVVALIVPTFLMGASLPVLGQALAGGGGHLGVGAGGLYALNTAGAAMGALAVPHVLLPHLGARAGGLAVVAGSIAVGCAALALDHVASRPGAVAPPPPTPRSRSLSRGDGVAPRAGRVLLLFAFVSGALTLGLQAAWTRMLALVHESSVHSFAAVLAVFLVGLAIGAGIARHLLRRGSAPSALLVAGWLGGGLAVLLSPRLFWWATDGLRFMAEGGGPAQELRVGAVAALVMMPATALLGMVLPVLMELAGREAPAAGPVLGRLLAANTLGAIAGPLLATFALAPRLGTWWTLALLAAAMMLAGEVSGAALRPGARAGLRRVAAWGAIAVAVVISRPGALPRVSLGRGERLVSLREGPLGTAAVIERDGGLRIKLDNSYTIGGTLSAPDERLQAHLPLLLHPAPRRVAFLGLGTGITAGGALLHPVESLEAVELVPAMLEAARNELAPFNGRLATDPRVILVADDARTWLLAREGRFDVVVGDLFVPWRRGEAALYSLEHLETMRAALAPGGLACQWVPLYQVSEDDFLSLARTFVEVFPRATLWRGDFSPENPAVALIGWRDDGLLLPGTVRARTGRMAAAPDELNPHLAHAAGVWMHLIGPLAPGDPLLLGAALNTDDRPRVELRSHRAGMARERRAFVGGAVTRLAESLRTRGLAGTPLEALDADALRWRDAGATLWRAAMLASDGRDAEADAVAGEALAALPQEVREAIMRPPPG